MIDEHHLAPGISALFDPEEAAWYLFNRENSLTGLNSGEMWPTWEAARKAFVDDEVEWS